MATDSEYILAYAKSSDFLQLADDEGRTVTTSYNREDENGRYSLDRLDKQSLGYHASLDFPIEGPDGVIYSVHHADLEHKVARWRWSKDTVAERYDELVFENGCVYTKNYESEGAMPRNILFEERFGRTRSGKTELFSIVGPNDFDNPKPSKLISYFLSLFPNNDCTVLDFFAGSGTTLNAVMRSNFLDGGKRTCILVTNNENQICETVTYPRNRNIITGYTSRGKNGVVLLSEKLTISKLKKSAALLKKIEDIKNSNKDAYDSFKFEVKDGFITLLGILDKSENIEGLKDNTLRYYRTEFVPRRATASNMRKLIKAATDLLCIKNGIYTERTHLGGNKLKPSALRYFSDGNEQMLVIYDERSIAPVVEVLAAMPKPENPIKVYMFSPNRYAFDDDFEDVADRVTTCALPAAIYDAYKRVLPKQKCQLIHQDAERKSTELGTDSEELPHCGLYGNETEKGGEV